LRLIRNGIESALSIRFIVLVFPPGVWDRLRCAGRFRNGAKEDAADSFRILPSKQSDAVGQGEPTWKYGTSNSYEMSIHLALARDWHVSCSSFLSEAFEKSF
jgi:hypothetical protein